MNISGTVGDSLQLWSFHNGNI